jgi:hypothetical protein
MRHLCVEVWRSPAIVLKLNMDSRRGRDDHRWPPPAQILTWAFTHTALTEDAPGLKLSL